MCVSVCKSDHISSVCLLQFDIVTVRGICNTASHIFTLDVFISAKRSNVRLQACVYVCVCACMHLCVCLFGSWIVKEKKKKLA